MNGDVFAPAVPRGIESVRWRRSAMQLYAGSAVQTNARDLEHARARRAVGERLDEPLFNWTQEVRPLFTASGAVERLPYRA